VVLCSSFLDWPISSCVAAVHGILITGLNTASDTITFAYIVCRCGAHDKMERERSQQQQQQQLYAGQSNKRNLRMSFIVSRLINRKVIEFSEMKCLSARVVYV